MYSIENRQNYIGGSDISAVMGVSRWKTPLKLWLEKTGQIEPDDLSNNEKVQMGIELEDWIAKKFARTEGLKVRVKKDAYVHPKYDFMACHIDRLITGTKQALECKNTDSRNKDQWIEDEIPKEYRLQCIWNMGISGIKEMWIAVLIGGNCFRYKLIKFDAELFKLMEEKAVEFWEMVKTKTPPPIILDSDGDNLIHLYPAHSEDMADVQDVEFAIEYLYEVKQQISDLKKEEEKLKTELRAVIKDNLGLETSEYRVTWRLQSNTKIDETKLKTDGLYNDYTYKCQSRVLRIFKLKEIA